MAIPPSVRDALNLTQTECANLIVFVDLLLKWQKAINLISKATASQIWTRHVMDSGQLRQYIPPNIFERQNVDVRIADLGAGAGFPGMILSIMGVPSIDLIESDGRKATFLREAARQLDLNVRIINQRAETVNDTTYDLVTARALASLPDLLQLTYPLLKTGGKLLILKGKTADEELTRCEKHWNMTVTKRPSITDAQGSVLLIEDIVPIHA